MRPAFGADVHNNIIYGSVVRTLHKGPFYNVAVSTPLNNGLRSSVEQQILNPLDSDKPSTWRNS